MIQKPVREGRPYGPARVWVYRWAWLETALQRIATVVLTVLLVWGLVALYGVVPELVVLLLAVLLGRALLYAFLRVVDPR